MARSDLPRIVFSIMLWGGLEATSHARVAVLSNTRASPTNAARSAPKAHDMARIISSMGTSAAVVSDLEAARGGLDNMDLVMVPYHAEMPKDVARSLEEFISQGGKAVFFYWVPDNLLSSMGLSLRGYVHQNQTRTGQDFYTVKFRGRSLEGSPKSFRQATWNIFDYKILRGGEAKVAAWWHDPKGRRSRYPAVFVSPRGAVMTHILLSKDGEPQRRFLLALLTHFLGKEVLGLAVHTKIRAATVSGGSGEMAVLPESLDFQSWQAFNWASEIEQRALRLRLESEPSRGTEFRAVWRHDPWVKNWNSSMKELKDQGFSAFFPNMCSSVAHYPSKFLPQSKRSLKQGDQMKKAMRYGDKHGIEIHLWRVNYLLRESEDLQIQMAEANRVQIKANGEPFRSGGGLVLCPSNPLNKELEINIMMEAAKRYKPAGIHLDYVRYPSTETCFCGTCRKLFQGQVGKTFVEWPSDVLIDDAMRLKWQQFRRDQITDLVQRVSAKIRKEAPGVKISAAVFANWNTVSEELGQDWKLWVEKGYLDFVCPMNYTPDPETFRKWVNAQTNWVSGRIPLIPGIGVFRIPSVEGVAQQVKIAREQGTDGYILFDHPRSEGPVDEGLALGTNRLPPGGLPLAGLNLEVSIPEKIWPGLENKGLYQGETDLQILMDWNKNISSINLGTDPRVEVLLVNGFDEILEKLGEWNPMEDPVSSWCLRLPEQGSSRILLRKIRTEEGDSFLVRSRPLRSVSLEQADFQKATQVWIWGPEVEGLEGAQNL